MKLLTEGQADPDFLASLDRKNNIIMCVPPTEPDTIIESNDFPDSFHITLNRDCNLSAPSIQNISLHAYADTIRPSIKISFPTGIKMKFDNFVDNPNQDIFWKVYKSYDALNVCGALGPTHHLIFDIKLTIYIDANRIRETINQMIIKKGTPILNFYFIWYMQTLMTMPIIDQIYLIQDQHIYEDFIQIF